MVYSLLFALNVYAEEYEPKNIAGESTITASGDENNWWIHHNFTVTTVKEATHTEAGLKESVLGSLYK